MYRLQVLDRGGAAKVEQVLPDPDVARTASFPCGDVREGVFHRSPCSESGASRGRLLKFPELLLLGLVVSNRDGAAPSGRRLRALRTQRTHSAGLRVELDRCARLESLDFACGAGDRFGAKVDLEVALAKQFGTSCALSPGLREDLATRQSSKAGCRGG